ncbi:unnamed protein product [Owenia fusiformis]|uniref:Fanconi anemia group D2 protein n=1 Tax=Owenia fusiformis TaxID=6347 RepID=A0A8S4NSR5_OWEFU|nr:unnamed protein product [Owenia fusiformis]
MVKARSKRRTASSDTVGGSPRKKAASGDDQHDRSVFGQLISEAGYCLKKGNRQNEIKVDQVMFQRNLTAAIKDHGNYPSVVEEFAEAFRTHIEDQNRLKWCLMPTLTASNCEESARGGNQDSLVRMIFHIDSLQTSMMHVLLEKLAEFSADDSNVLEGTETFNLPRLILNQFRWLDRIVNCQELTEKLIEMIGLTNIDIQRDIIACIPEVLDDSEHSNVARQLRDLLLESNELTVPILDALTNLNIPADLLSEMQGTVLRTLKSVALDDLPVVVKFLLQTATSKDVAQVVSELRQNLDFESSFPPVSSSTPHTNRRSKIVKENSKQGVEALILDAMRSAVRFQKSLADTWIKVIETVKTPSDHKVIDIFLLIIIHSSTSRKKPVESLLRNKVRKGAITEMLLQVTFGGHAEVLRDYFPSILHLAEVLLRSPEPQVSSFAGSMYKHAFSSFDSYCQQEIVGQLVTHIGSGMTAEVDASLAILADLVNTNLQRMAPFAIFVKGVLDYLDNLSMSQIRKLYSMLSMLAFQPGEEGGLIQDDLHIVIRKQLSNNNTRYKRMGIIGALMVVKCMASTKPDSSLDNSSTLDTGVSEDIYNQVVNLLQLVRASSDSVPETSALFMDELACIVEQGNLDTKVETWISENVISDFQDDYVVDIDKSPNTRNSLLEWESLLGLDDEEEGGIAINLLPLLMQNMKQKQTLTNHSKSKQRLVSPAGLAPHFRLLRVCEQKQRNGNLEEIDALLGCPVNMFKMEILSKVESLSSTEKELICSSMFYLVNWFREVVNAFASQDDPEMKGKVISRLQAITTIHKQLEKCLSVVGKYVPPVCHFAAEDSLLPTVSKPPQAARNPKKALNKRKRDSPDTTIDSQTSQTTQLNKSTEDDKVPSNGPSISIANYKYYFRELDMSVFSILSTTFITKAALDTNMNTEESTTLRLQPEQLEFLLEDLSSKLDHSLIASANKRRTFLKTKNDKSVGHFHLDQFTPTDVCQKLTELLPSLCAHLEGASAFFQTMIAENDGVLDGPGCHSDEANTMARCYHHILQIMLSLLSWCGHQLPENRVRLKELLGVLASRTKTFSQSQLPILDLYRDTFKYFENFVSDVPNISTAVLLTRLLVTIATKTEKEEFNKRIETVTGAILKREWFNEDGEREKGAKFNENLQILLKYHVEYSEDKLSQLEAISSVGIPELVETHKKGCSETYPTLTRCSYPVYYKVLLSELVDHVKNFSISKQTETAESRLEKLIKWNLAVRIFHILVNLIKAFDARTNLGAVLKYGRQFVDHFLRSGMPLMDGMFRAHKEDVQGLLKNLQLSTRSLHHMCGHSKILKDVSITKQVPLLKKTLEAFVYRVKAMLTLNKCLEAFWMGNLKNRDLKGEEILSQVSHNADGSDTDNDAESLPEDSSSDSEQEGSEHSNSDTRSEVTAIEEESYSESY